MPSRRPKDIKRFISDAEIDWLVEDSFADIPRHVAGVSEVIECSVRKWKKRVFEKATRDQIKALREKLRSKHYDLVIDLQGLIKSAVLCFLDECTGSRIRPSLGKGTAGHHSVFR